MRTSLHSGAHTSFVILASLLAATTALGLTACGSTTTVEYITQGDDAGEATGDDSEQSADAGTTKTSSKDAAPAQLSVGDSGIPGVGASSAEDAAPTTSASTADASQAATPTNGFDQFQQHNLETVNMYRATMGIAPLVLDKTLSTFALAGSVELSMDHTPHQHFINASNDMSIWNDGFNMNAGENQGDPNGWYVMSQDPTTNEIDQIDDIQKQMFAEGPGTGEAHGHYMNMMNATFTRLGVGLLEVDNQLYLTNDFSD